MGNVLAQHETPRPSAPPAPPHPARRGSRHRPCAEERRGVGRWRRCRTALSSSSPSASRRRRRRPRARATIGVDQPSERPARTAAAGNRARRCGRGAGYRRRAAACRWMRSQVVWNRGEARDLCSSVANRMSLNVPAGARPRDPGQVREHRVRRVRPCRQGVASSAGSQGAAGAGLVEAAQPGMQRVGEAGGPAQGARRRASCSGSGSRLVISRARPRISTIRLPQARRAPPAVVAGAVAEAQEDRQREGDRVKGADAGGDRKPLRMPLLPGPPRGRRGRRWRSPRATFGRIEPRRANRMVSRPGRGRTIMGRVSVCTGLDQTAQEGLARASSSRVMNSSG